MAELQIYPYSKNGAYVISCDADGTINPYSGTHRLVRFILRISNGGSPNPTINGTVNNSYITTGDEGLYEQTNITFTYSPAGVFEARAVVAPTEVIPMETDVTFWAHIRYQINNNYGSQYFRFRDSSRSIVMDFNKNGGMGIGTPARKADLLEIDKKTTCYDSVEVFNCDDGIEAGFCVKKSSPIANPSHPDMFYNSVWMGVGASGVHRGLLDGSSSDMSSNGRWLIYTDEEQESITKPIKFGPHNAGVRTNSSAASYITVESGWSLDSASWAYYARWGRVAFVSIRLRRTGDAVSTGNIQNIKMATLTSNICPCGMCSFAVTGAGGLLGGYINSDGHVMLCSTGSGIPTQTSSGSVSISFSAIYLLNDGASGIIN